MYDEGYKHITNNDISPICIKSMKRRNDKVRPMMKWDVMDIREMSYRDESFDLIIDKSTIDALLCGSQAHLNVALMMKECQRVLKTGGVYVAISYGGPENREHHLTRPNLGFDVRIYKIERAAQENPDPRGAKAQPTVHYVYVCIKIDDANQRH